MKRQSEKPTPNGSAWENYVADSLDELLADKQSRSKWFSKQNVLILASFALTVVLAYARIEAHVADAAHTHWSSTDLDNLIDRRDALTQRSDTEKIAEIGADVKDIKARLDFFRSDRDVDWQHIKERILILEQKNSLRAWRPKRDDDDTAR